MIPITTLRDYWKGGIRDYLQDKYELELKAITKWNDFAEDVIKIKITIGEVHMVLTDLLSGKDLQEKLDQFAFRVLIDPTFGGVGYSYD